MFIDESITGTFFPLLPSAGKAEIERQVTENTGESTQLTWEQTTCFGHQRMMIRKCVNGTVEPDAGQKLVGACRGAIVGREISSRGDGIKFLSEMKMGEEIHAMMSRTTLPWTSVRRKSRPA